MCVNVWMTGSWRLIRLLDLDVGPSGLAVWLGALQISTVLGLGPPPFMASFAFKGCSLLRSLGPATSRPRARFRTSVASLAQEALGACQGGSWECWDFIVLRTRVLCLMPSLRGNALAAAKGCPFMLGFFFQHSECHTWRLRCHFVRTQKH